MREQDKPGPLIRLRPADQGDVFALVSIIQGAFFEYLGRLDPPSGAHAESPASVLQMLRNEHALLAEVAGKPVGCVFFAPNERRAPPGVRELYLHRLGVLPQWRRLGIATRLMDAAELWAVENGFESVALGVRIVLPATRHFYERRDYRVSEFATHAGYGHTTAIILRKRLTAPPPRAVVVATWSPEWAAEYTRAAAEVRRLLEGALSATFHVGSTAVPHMAAKPTIDILGVARSLEAVEARDEALFRAGWQPFGEHGLPGRLFYRKGTDAEHTHHLHVHPVGHPEITAKVALVAWLKAHPDEAAAYGARKLRLAVAFPLDIGGYAEGKDAYVEEMRARALAWWRLWRGGS